MVERDTNVHVCSVLRFTLNCVSLYVQLSYPNVLTNSQLNGFQYIYLVVLCGEGFGASDSGQLLHVSVAARGKVEVHVVDFAFIFENYLSLIF